MKRLSADPKPDNNDESTEMAPSAQIPFADNRESKYRFQRESILLNAPESSGVYGLFSALWIYIGEAENLRARLLEHLDGENPCKFVISHPVSRSSSFRPPGGVFDTGSWSQNCSPCARGKPSRIDSGHSLRLRLDTRISRSRLLSSKFKYRPICVGHIFDGVKQPHSNPFSSASNWKYAAYAD